MLAACATASSYTCRGTDADASTSRSPGRGWPSWSTDASGTAAQTTGRAPSNREWWDWKIARNTERDRDTDQLLAEHGWTVVRVWEHEDPDEAAGRVETIVRQRRP